MITLYGFAPLLDLPDASPFVVKVMLLLKFAGLTYRKVPGSLWTSPKGKLPYIVDDGVTISDSTFIRFHIEAKYGFDFDAGLSPAAKASAWAIEKMCEEHLYWALVDMRWCDTANFEHGVGHFFDRLPALIRPLATCFIRRKVSGLLKAQGMGRHTHAEIAELACRDLAAIADVLGEKPFLMGEKPCAADATVLAFVSAVLSDMCVSPIRTAAIENATLVTYRDRLMRHYFTMPPC